MEEALRHYGHIMRHLMGLEYSVHLWTMEPIDERLVDTLVPGLKCHRLPLVKGQHRLVDAMRTLVRGFQIALRHPDALFTTWSLQTNVLCGIPIRLLRRRCIFLLAGMGSVFSSDAPLMRGARRGVVPLYRWFFSGERSRVVVQNRDDLRYVTTVLGASPERVFLMHGCGVEEREFPYSAELPKRIPPVVLVPARLIREKGIFEAAEASRILWQRGMEHEMWFSSDVDPGNPHSLTRDDVEALRHHCPSIHVLGWQPSVLPLILAARMVCLPTYREGLPTALVEAAACGRPIVTTDTIGPRDIVTHEETGLLVPVGDAQTLADAIARLLHDDDLADRLRRNARLHYERECTRSATLQQALRAYRSLGVAAQPYRGTRPASSRAPLPKRRAAQWRM